MEQFPQANEEEQPRPRLDLDLSGPDGNVFDVVMLAREKLEGDARTKFDLAIREATQPGAGKKYDDILSIVNSHMDLTDTSGLYPQYAPKPPEE